MKAISAAIIALTGAVTLVAAPNVRPDDMGYALYIVGCALLTVGVIWWAGYTRTEK
jgi:hypothetical protein